MPIHRQQFEGSAKEEPVVLVLHFLRPSTHFYVHITRKSKGFLISGNVAENKTLEPLLFVSQLQACSVCQMEVEAGMLCQMEVEETNWAANAD